MIDLVPLRPYQEHLVARVRQEFRRHRNVLLQLATGAGKTVIMARLIQLGMRNRATGLFIVHRRELLHQTRQTLEEFLPRGTPISMIAPGWPYIPWAPVHLATVQTLARRLQKPQFIDRFLSTVSGSLNLFEDEAHHSRAATWEQVKLRLPQARILGATASPQRSDGLGMGKHFGAMVCGPSTGELIEMGWLAPTRVMSTPMPIDLMDVRSTKSGDYRQDDLDKKVDAKMVVSAASTYRNYAAGRQCIFFGINTDHSRRVAAEMRAHGFRAEHVDGRDHAARRDRIMGEFRDGVVQVVCNCQLIDEGFDAPSCEVVMIGVPTKSIVRYLQMVGRAMRPGEGKEALILDLVGCAHDLGLPTDRRRWTLEDGEITHREATRPRPQVCERCATVYRVHPCPRCGWRPPLPQVEDVDVPLTEMTQTPPKRDRRRKKRSEPKITRPELMRRVVAAKKSANPEQAVRALGRELGYHPNWALRVLSGFS